MYVNDTSVKDDIILQDNKYVRVYGINLGIRALLEFIAEIIFKLQVQQKCGFQIIFPGGYNMLKKMANAFIIQITVLFKS